MFVKANQNFDLFLMQELHIKKNRTDHFWNVSVLILNVSRQYLQVTSTVVEVNGDSSGQSSPTAEGQHTYITVTTEPLGKCKQKTVYFYNCYLLIRHDLLFYY